jgi:hypothetical protein
MQVVGSIPTGAQNTALTRCFSFEIREMDGVATDMWHWLGDCGSPMKGAEVERDDGASRSGF